jgi:tetratricopeptide (TPR) repeat protein
LARRQVHVWRDGVTLFEHAVAVTPAISSRTTIWAWNSTVADARERWRITGDAAPPPTDRHGTRNFAMASFAKGATVRPGQYDEAMASYRRDCATSGTRHWRTYVGLIPRLGTPLPPSRHWAGAQDRSSLAQAHMGLAVALEALGKGVEARREFAETLRLDASNVEAHYDLGLIMARTGEDRAALREFDAAIRLKPDFGPAHVARAYTLYALGLFAEAGRAVQAARVAKVEVNAGFEAELAHRLWR